MYESFVQIATLSPPMDDVPRDLPDEVHSFIRDGWTVDKARRPSAAELLEHDAFRLLGWCFCVISTSHCGRVIRCVCNRI